MKKLRTSTKIFIGFVVISAAVIFGAHQASEWMIMGQKFAPIEPRRVNIVGIDPGAGYQIIVANQVAQLVQTQGKFEDSGHGANGAESGSIKQHIPVDDLLGTLRGDPKSLGNFVMAIDGLDENNLPPVRVLWTQKDIESALNGDQALQSKLERDLNIHLDGTPLPSLTVSSLENGIVIEMPVTVTVPINAQMKPIHGTILEAYQPRLLKTVAYDYSDKPRVTTAMRVGYYLKEARKVLAYPRMRENVRKVLGAMIDSAASDELVRVPARILHSAFIVLNDKFITHASYNTYTSNDGKPLHDLTLDLNDEGRRRLWQFTENRVGQQLLLVADGIAIAAPRIDHPLIQGQITITAMPDQVLLQEAVDDIDGAKGDQS